MNDYVIVSGDQAIFLPSFGGAVVTVAPGIIVASSDLKAQSVPVCLEGDESTVIVPGCAYMRPPYVIPGIGIITIDDLNTNQLTINSTYNGRRIILKGITFDAKFTVVSPAWKPGETWIPDSSVSYNGTGSFLTTNTKVKIS